MTPPTTAPIGPPIAAPAAAPATNASSFSNEPAVLAFFISFCNFFSSSFAAFVLRSVEISSGLYVAASYISYAASPKPAIAPTTGIPLNAFAPIALAPVLSADAPAFDAAVPAFAAAFPALPAPLNPAKPDAPLIAPVNALKPPFTTSDITMAVNKLIITLNPPDTISSIVKLLPNISSISADKLPNIPPSNKPEVAVFILVIIESIRPPSLPPC